MTFGFLECIFVLVHLINLLAMTDIYHICMTAHNEVLFRSPDDFRDITNLIAYKAYTDGVHILVDALMSNHMHFVVYSDNPEKFALSLRLSITKHFNIKHHRSGRLFDRKVFICALAGPRHITMAVNYVLKNPVHHGQAYTPYSYANCTANYLFTDDRGVKLPELTNDRTFIRRFFPKNAKIPSDFKLDRDGMISRSSFEEIKMVESFFLTPNYFIYNMNRKTSDDWVKEQEQDGGNQPPVTLELIENGVKIDSLKKMLSNENTVSTQRQQNTDMAVCQLIDNKLLFRYNSSSIYTLDIEKRLQIGMELIQSHFISTAQAARCAVVPFAELENERKALQGLIRSR